MNIGDCEIGAPLVRQPAELGGTHHALNGPRRVPERTGDVDPRVREVALKGDLVRKIRAVELSGNVEVLFQRLLRDEPETLIDSN